MNVKIFEIIFFIILSLFLINKLLSILGSVEEDEENISKKKPSFFGEPGNIIDVTDFKEKRDKELNAQISEEDRVRSMIPDFNSSNFLKGAKAAFFIIIKAYKEQDQATLDELVDKRFKEDFFNEIKIYKEHLDEEKISSKISNINIFGNNVIIKVLFSGAGIDNSEWTFIKSALSEGPNWYLSNIETINANE